MCLVLLPALRPEPDWPVPSYPQSTGRVRVLEDNEEALLWRLRLIESARERLVLATFDFRDDSSGRDLMASLYAAADRGVRVEMLIDGIGGVMHLSTSGAFRELAEHPNVTVRLYNPVNLLTPWRTNYRLHDKYLIADDWGYILGGRNTSDLFLGAPDASANEDRDILVYEPEGEETTCSGLLAYFDSVWNLSCCKDFSGHGAPANLGDHYRAMTSRCPEAFEIPDWNDATLPTDGLTLLHGDPRPRIKAPTLWRALVGSMERADQVTIITPYLICGREMYGDLTDLTSQGTQVRVLLNAVEKGANVFGCADYLNQQERLLECGLELCEYWGTHSMHTKTILIDDTVSIVGSCNADMRSVYLDTELMLVIESGEINRQLRQTVETMMERSRIRTPDGGLQVGTEFPEGDTPVWKQVLYGLLRVLTLPVRHLL